VLPHRERPGREARIARAAVEFGARFRPLGDRDVLVF
jgi:hypothetical protein